MEWGWPNVGNTTTTETMAAGDQDITCTVNGMGATKLTFIGTFTAGKIIVKDSDGHTLKLFDEFGRPVSNPVENTGGAADLVYWFDAAGLSSFLITADPEFAGSLSVKAISSPLSTSMPLNPTHTEGG
jgi:hypothetical protein